MCLLALAVLSAILYLPHLSSYGLLDPDEPFYSLTAKEMLQRGDPFTPVMFGEPQFEKPIFIYWVLYASFKSLGVNEFAARIGVAAAGTLTVLATYLWGLALFRRRLIALIAAALLATSAEFIVLSRIVLTDIFLCLFVTAALASYSWGRRFPQHRPIAWHGVFLFCALGFLTKGPLGVLLPFFGILALAARGKDKKALKLPWASGIVLFFIIVVPWFWLMTDHYGVDFLRQTFVHENLRRFFFAEHRGNDKPFYYLLALALGFYPWTLFLPAGIGLAIQRGFRKRSEAFFLLAALFVSVFVFFTVAKSKLMSYIFPVFPVISLMSAAWFYRFWRAMGQGASPKRSFLFLAALLWGVLPFAVAPVLYYLARQEKMEAAGVVIVLGLILVPFSWASLFLLWKRRVNEAFVCMLSMAVAAHFFLYGWIFPAIDPALSSKQAVAFYKKVEPAFRTRFVLASKLFVRGVSYYTDNPDVGVLSEKKKVFYTSHPVPIISSLDDLMSLPAGHYPVFCFLRHKELKFLKSISEGRFVVEVVHDEAERSLVRLSRHAS